MTFTSNEFEPKSIKKKKEKELPPSPWRHITNFILHEEPETFKFTLKAIKNNYNGNFVHFITSFCCDSKGVI